MGFNPTTPQNEEGTLIDPPVSVPNAPKQSEADTAAADPPLEPPAILLIDHGFLLVP